MNDVTARPAIAISVLLNALYHLPWFGQPVSAILFVLGSVMIVAFVALNISAIRVCTGRERL
jgi:membrane protease YdiL (CAAX protease family)